MPFTAEAQGRKEGAKELFAPLRLCGEKNSDN
jgi:hypothetical protein